DKDIVIWLSVLNVFLWKFFLSKSRVNQSTYLSRSSKNNHIWSPPFCNSLGSVFLLCERSINNDNSCDSQCSCKNALNLSIVKLRYVDSYKVLVKSEKLFSLSVVVEICHCISVHPQVSNCMTIVPCCFDRGTNIVDDISGRITPNHRYTRLVARRNIIVDTNS